MIDSYLPMVVALNPKMATSWMEVAL